MTGSRSLHRTLGLVAAPVRTAISHRALLKTFVIREVRGRFEGTMAGVSWTLIQPLATVLVYLFIFSVILRMRVAPEENGTESFAVFMLTGMVPWLLLSEGLSRSVGCLVENAGLITKVAFPNELIPTGKVLAAFLMNGAGFGLLLVYLAAKGHAGVSWFWVLLLLPLEMFFTLGLASFLAAACVFIRDIRELLTIFLMVWFFSTPVVYPISMAPQSVRPLMSINPLFGFISLFRDVLLLHRLDWSMLAYVSVMTALAYMGGAWFFMRAKPAFGDVL